MNLASELDSAHSRINFHNFLLHIHFAKTALNLMINSQIALMRKLFALVLLLLFTAVSKSQVQIGVFGGASNYLGDMTEKLYQNPGVALGFNLGYQLTDRINLRGGFTYAKVKAADSLNTQQDIVLRNLSFQTSITELSVVGEFNTFDLNIKAWTPYLFGGLAVYHFNPYTFNQQGLKVFLQPLGTEGQGLPGYPQTKLYSRAQLAIPFGGGFKYNISDKVRIALEVGLRKLFTDYLDDVSGNYADPNELMAERGQPSVDLSYREDELPSGDLNYPVKGETRGSPKYKDYYYFSGLHLTYVLSTGDGSSRLYSSKRGRNKRFGCPTVF